MAATTSTTITWIWDAVEDVLGYQGQFSPDATFTETDPTFIIPAPLTSHTVQNLSGNMTGYFRVRSGVGVAVTDLTFSEWTEGVSGTTAAPPPAVALAAPDNVESTDRTEDSITLEWDSVANAETYEVEQREPGDDWSDAACGADDADNVVDEEECVASGLEEGTDYDFRVRGVPADDDEAYTVGAWSDTVESRTEGTGPATTPTTPTVSGGMGTLNVTWETGDVSGTQSVIWSWEPVAGATYEWKIVENPPDFEAEDPCGTTGFDQSGTQFSASSAATNPLLLCVRTMDDADQPDLKKDLSWAFAHREPQPPRRRWAISLRPARKAREPER